MDELTAAEQLDDIRLGALVNLSRVVEAAQVGIAPCKICRYLPDTPNHELGCPVGQAQVFLNEQLEARPS